MGARHHNRHYLIIKNWRKRTPSSRSSKCPQGATWLPFLVASCRNVTSNGHGAPGPPQPCSRLVHERAEPVVAITPEPHESRVVIECLIVLFQLPMRLGTRDVSRAQVNEVVHRPFRNRAVPRNRFGVTTEIPQQ